ncbi:MAG: hypothetical protein CVU42_07150 [Chloroflexi bacterium HGW-Chloroflexi-4]|jgi:hypothetical protein|nr:MAG: hypothetical protein CVU42_07150 [Chloroflexi bacterium HGW-Chloroflexi-4]
MSKKNILSSFFHSEITSRILTILAVFSVLVIAILLSGPKPLDYTEESAAVTQVALVDNGEITANLADLITEPPVTSGVIVGTTAVLVIIFVGTMIEMRRNSK